MDAVNLGERLSQLLPKIKTRLQLSGLVIALVFSLFVHFAKPGDLLALITAGGVGISFLIFGQLFHFLKDFKEDERPKIFLASFTIFCLFTLTLLILTIVLVRRPSMSISQFSPSPELLGASHENIQNQEPVAKKPASKTRPTSDQLTSNDQIVKSGGSNEISNGVGTVEITKNVPRDAEYVFKMVDGIPTLNAHLLYTVNSRKLLYPDADFHEDVSFGSPWLSLDVANPSNQAVFFTSLKTEALKIQLINEVIPHVPDIENATPADAILKIVNEGWGKARHPKLELRYARPVTEGIYPSQNRFVIVGQAIFPLDDFDEGINVQLGGTLPPLEKWWHQKGFKPEEFCKKDGYLALLGRLEYIDESAANRVETFQARVMTCIGGGGNAFPTAAFNITLPTDSSDYPLYTTVANCIGPNSADELIVRVTAKRSSHFLLRFTLTATSGISVQREASVDVLVPRVEYTSPYHDGSFFKAADARGCS